MPKRLKQFLLTDYLIYSSLAQLAEHLTVNQVVAGSSPAGGANKKTIKRWSFLFATLGLEPMLKHTVRDTRSPFPKYGRCASFDTSFTLIRSTPYFGYTFIKIILNDFYFTLPAGGGISVQQFCTLTQKSL